MEEVAGLSVHFVAAAVVVGSRYYVVAKLAVVSCRIAGEHPCSVCMVAGIAGLKRSPLLVAETRRVI